MEEKREKMMDASVSDASSVVSLPSSSPPSPAAGYHNHQTKQQQQQQQQTRQRQRVIILGGSSFMGLGLLEALTTTTTTTTTTHENDQHLVEQFESIHVLNRGNNYWDNKANKILYHKKFSSNSKVKDWIVDRDDDDKSKQEYGELIRKLCTDTTDTLGAEDIQTTIVDFCAYSLDDLKTVLYHSSTREGGSKDDNETTTKPLLPLLKQYIYISTDSVYEATSLYRLLKHKHTTSHPSSSSSSEKKKKEKLPIDDDALLLQEDRSEHGGTTETMADDMDISVTQMKHTNKAMYKKLHDNDSYGLRKLQVERELFLHFSPEAKVKVLSLRLADVIGPYDDSCRFWKYLLWARVANTNWPITLDEEDRNRKLSFTFSQDVVQIIMDQLLTDIETKSHGTYNIAMKERPTLEEFLQYFCCAPDAIQYSDKGSATTFYPSVDLGPISIQKAIKEFKNFHPTSLQEAMKQTINFFTSIQPKEYIPEKIEVISKLPRRIKYYYIS